MERIDNDSNMIDVPETQRSSRLLRPTIECEEPPLKGQILRERTPRPTNRGLNPDRAGSPTPKGESGFFNPSKKRRHESRENSILATDVANMLSIETPINGMQIQDEHDRLDGMDVNRLPSVPYLSSLPTGLCYDVRMRYHCELDPPKLRLDYHPEDPRRIFKIYRELCIAGLVKDDALNTGPLISNPLVRLTLRDATEAEVCSVHDKSHWDYMRSTPSSSFFPFLGPAKAHQYHRNGV